MKLYYDTLEIITGRDEKAVLEARERLNSRMKPMGSLGSLEELAIQYAGITGSLYNSSKKRCHIVASSDNGVIVEGISSCPVEYTPLVSEAMLNKVAAIGILCNSIGVDIKVVDIGMSGDIPRDYPNLYRKKIARGTKNLRYESAMTKDQCITAIEVGIGMIDEFKDYDIFSNGEMGIGNTTTSSAILYAFTGEPLDLIVGRGGGLSDEGLTRKKMVIEEALKNNKVDVFDPLDILTKVGGFDIACIVGLYLGAAKNKKPILIDGFISSVAALVAVKIKPECRDYMMATHRSEEPGMEIIIKELKISPILNMNMRLGEGTGAVLAYPIIEGALEIIKNMKVPDEVYNMFK